jgi:hypothetical protein
MQVCFDSTKHKFAHLALAPFMRQTLALCGAVQLPTQQALKRCGCCVQSSLACVCLLTVTLTGCLKRTASCNDIRIYINNSLNRPPPVAVASYPNSLP